ncbi:hypothetical protein LSAT2_001070, partial [Lamellibrachia satsuma]
CRVAALRIHISETTKELLEEFETFIIQERGPVDLKGKGCMNTFWLAGENKV